MEYILNKIKEYKKIIILRHTNPDLDALGSQIGLALSIKENFPDKMVLISGDTNKFTFLGDMDEVKDLDFVDALCIICDVATSKMISDHRYLSSKEIIVIDHHTNDVYLDCEEGKCNVPYYSLIKPNYASCTELISDLIMRWNWKMPKKAATALYGGIVTDSGRFQFGTEDMAHLFEVSAYLMKNGADAQFIYRNLYVESLESRLMKNYFQSKMQLTQNNVAYMMNDKDVFDKFNVDTFTVSRGMVNLMAGIDKVYIWANFTLDVATNKVWCEFRSRDVIIVDIAKKYGGGGHDYACGATVDNFGVALDILDDFDKRMEEINNVQ